MSDRRTVFGGNAVRKLDNFINENKTLWWFTFVLLFIILVLLYTIVSRETEVVVELPTQLIVGDQTSIKVGNRFGSNAFWEIWAKGVAAEMGQVTGTNADQKVALVLSYMSPRDRVEFSDAIEKIAKFIKTNKAEQAFQPRSYDIKTRRDGSGAVANITGVGSLTIGSNKPIEAECGYKFEFNKEMGYVYLVSFSTDCFSAGTYNLASHGQGSAAGNGN